MVRLKARRWDIVALAAVALGVAGWLVGQELVGIPLLLERVPLRALVPGIAVIAATYPLLDRYPGFAEMLARERPLRPWRVLGATALFAIALCPAVLTEGTDVNVPGELAVGLGFLVLGLVSVVVAGDLAWLIVLTATFAILFLNAPPAEPVSRVAASSAMLAPLAALYLVAAIAYVWVGPRRRHLAL